MPATGSKALPGRQTRYPPQAARAKSVRLALALIFFRRRLTRRRRLPRLASPASTYEVETVSPPHTAFGRHHSLTRLGALVIPEPGIRPVIRAPLVTDKASRQSYTRTGCWRQADRAAAPVGGTGSPGSHPAPAA